ncbi:MAG: hypothetical protein R2728_00765 [Chitinophagales bacterium]
MIEVDGNLIVSETKTEITPYQIAAIEKQKAKIKEEGFIVWTLHNAKKQKNY